MVFRILQCLISRCSRIVHGTVSMFFPITPLGFTKVTLIYKNATIYSVNLSFCSTTSIKEFRLFSHTMSSSRFGRLKRSRNRSRNLFNELRICFLSFKTIANFRGFIAPFISGISNPGTTIVEYSDCKTHAAPISFKHAGLA